MKPENKEERFDNNGNTTNWYEQQILNRTKNFTDLENLEFHIGQITYFLNSQLIAMGSSERVYRMNKVMYEKFVLGE